uniref:Uncharacterized protein n=1 Tax=Varanus komodoensis TaxID=61221 RepID=A0A8D2IV79_VARKO
MMATHLSRANLVYEKYYCQADSGNFGRVLASDTALTPTASVTPSSHLILCCPLLLLPSIVPSIRLFSSESFFSLGGQSI